jgi:hypothetical protein
MDDPRSDGGVVAFPQVTEDFRVEAGAVAGAGVLDRPVGLAEDLDDLGGPVLDAAGAELHDLPGAAARDRLRVIIE